jgi:hypothetical protein
VTAHFGLSSGAMPDAGAPRLIEVLRAHGGDVVDLRVGKGHAWEADGLAPFLDAGISVSFLGVGVNLGVDAAEHEVEALRRQLDGREVPIKVFAAEELDDPGRRGAAAARQAAQEVRLLASLGPVLVETHHGHAGPDALRRLCDDTGAKLVLDVLGWWRLTGTFDDSDGLVAQETKAVQVKGFRPVEPVRHLPLAELPHEAWELVDTVSDAVPATLESKADSIVADLGVLNRWATSRGAAK